ncbi:MAG: hypothetical protein GX621_05160, partial [Pirellulaceae bacterium]|nr:hypothetical protein [Pirellulaceae bacterium]
TAQQVEWVYRDIDAKRRVARYLHAAPLLVERCSAPAPGCEEPPMPMTAEGGYPTCGWSIYGDPIYGWSINGY